MEWEYLIVRIVGGRCQSVSLTIGDYEVAYNDALNGKEIIYVLRRLGKERWELVTMYQSPEQGAFEYKDLYFKRPR